MPLAAFPQTRPIAEMSAVSSFRLPASAIVTCAFPARFRASQRCEESQPRSNRASGVINHLLREMKKVDPSSSRADAAKQFAGMAVDERARLEAKFEPAASSREGGDALDTVGFLTQVERDSVSTWSPSDGEYPVGLEALMDCVGRETGFASHGARVRGAKKFCPYSVDSGKIPDGETVLHRYTCAERHPGLCWAKDAAIYVPALQLAKNLEAFCTAGRRGSFILLWSGDDEFKCILSCGLRLAPRRAWASGQSNES